MRRFWIVLFVVLVVGLGLYVGVGYLNRNYFRINPKNIYELTLDKDEDAVEVLFPQGSDIDTPLRVQTGFRIALFADLKTIGSPRVMEFDNNGTLIVSVPEAGQIIALPDNDDDGVADDMKIVLSGLSRPHGIAFNGNKLFVAEENKVTVYDYDSSDRSVQNGFKILDLPGGGRHWSRTIKIYNDKLYISVGSSCDVCEESDTKRAAILISNLDGSKVEKYATGLRNTVFFVFDDQGKIWGNDMGRDFLGDNLPPDELNVIEQGKNYGWPRCYGEKTRDNLYRSWEALAVCQNTQSTVFDYPAHVAPLGITFINSPLFSKEEQGNILTAFHGSWNSSVPVGYKIVKLTIEENNVTQMEDFITGWLQGDEVLGRPVDLVFSESGVLYISDDKADVIYLLTKSNGQQ